MSIEITLVLIVELTVLYLLTRRAGNGRADKLMVARIDNRVPDYAKWPHGAKKSGRSR